jgi:hypothetical protein
MRTYSSSGLVAATATYVLVATTDLLVLYIAVAMRTYSSSGLVAATAIYVLLAIYMCPLTYSYMSS